MKNTPVYNMVKNYKSKMRFHMPGHKGRLSRFDITELSFSDNLLSPKASIKQLNEKLAKHYECEYAHILTCGGSMGIHAMLSRYKGKTLLVDRYSHSSVYHALRIYGITPIFFNAEITLECRAADINEILQKADNADGVVVTYPTYVGEVFDISILYRELKKKGKAVLVDACHAAHFAYSDLLPQNPAPFSDICVFGLHKTTLALTQAALICSNVGSLEKDIRKIHSTSPSYLICCSIDISHENMLKYYSRFIARLKELVPSNNNDLTKFVLKTKNGYETGKLLEEVGIFAEMYLYDRVLFLLSMGNRFSEIRRLLKVSKKYESRCETAGISYKSRSGDFLKEGQTEIVPLDMAEGRNCASLAGLYPPGVPIVCFGDRIEKEVIEILTEYAPYAFGIDGGIEVFI